MHSHFKLNLTAQKTEILSHHTLPSFCTFPLNIAKAQKITINEGKILVQSISHYLACIELFEYSLTHETKVDFSINEATFFMYAILNNNSCQLCYQPAGNYQQVIPAGVHKILMITFKPEWLIHKSQRLTELKPFVAAYNNSENKPIRLPNFGIAVSLFKSLKKTDIKINNVALDNDGYLFVNSSINKYYNKLITRHATSCYHQHKAMAISEFVRQNFATELVDDLPNLAARFMVSERHLARLAKMAFGVPLHTQVIKIRMNSGLNHLFTTDTPIHEISRLIGYREPHYFSKAFKKHFGVSPRSLGER